MDVGTGTVVAAVASGSNGYFTVAVKPGRYVIRLVGIGNGPPEAWMPEMVTVTAGHYTSVTLRFNTGVN